MPWRFLPPILLLTTVSCPPAAADKGPCQWALVRLDYARREKVEQLERFRDTIHASASRAREDDVLVEFLDVHVKYDRMRRNGSADERLVARVAEFHHALNDYYINHYLAFHDMLFVGADGRILYSVRRESDRLRSFFQGSAAETPLGRCLRRKPEDELFIDFHQYAPSDEPAAFFVEPVRKNGELLGWCVLQCAINKINSLFTGMERLGETGEAFVVNREGYMLTESNFRGESTILKTRLDDRNIAAKFKEGEGHRRVIDYRGCEALTSFQVVHMLGTPWLVVAKVDVAEILTDHYRNHRQYFADRVVEHLAAQPRCHDPDRPGGAPGTPSDRGTEPTAVHVDMDEFVRATHGEILRTVGVSTCTAVVATYPGKFGYLAHISPHDRIYGGSATNLLGHVVKKIKTYDIYKFERRDVRFLIVVRQLGSLTRAIDKLVEEGFLLSQISIIYNPHARCANVTYDYSRDRVSVEWLPQQTPGASCVHHAGDAHNLDDIVKTFVGG